MTEVIKPEHSTQWHMARIFLKDQIWHFYQFRGQFARMKRPSKRINSRRRMMREFESVKKNSDMTKGEIRHYYKMLDYFFTPKQSK